MTLFDPGEDRLPGLSSVHFIDLKLRDSAGVLLSSNFYWRGKQEWKYDEMGSMKPVKLRANPGELKDGKLTVDLENATGNIALAARLKVVDLESGQLAAPVLYSDNYISLVPKESRRVEIDFKFVRPAHRMKLLLEGWNVETAEVTELHR